jgi:FkbM family methyltransferase
MGFLRRHLHYFIVVGILATVSSIVLVYFLGRRSAFLERLPYIAGEDELRPLELKYGGQRDSLLAEEWIIRDFFQDKRDGVFLDVGANDYRFGSNTYYLETELGWSGLAIEPQTKFAADYARHRPRTRFLPLFVSDVSNQEASLYVPADDLLASGSRAEAASGGEIVDVIKAQTTTLDDILDRSGVQVLDFLTIDIELHEPQALAGFSIERFRPALVCIEAHQEVRQQILDYFARHGYVVVGNYLRADAHNLWFKPLESGR